VTLQLQGKVLHIQGEGVDLQMPWADVQWPERTRAYVRVAHFKSGGSLQCADGAAWDDWRAAAGQRESWVVTLQQSWRWVLFSTVLLIALLFALQRWGVPVAARAVVAVTPLSVDRALGDAVLTAVDQQFMQASQLPVAEQVRLRQALSRAVAAMPAGSVPAWQLVFRKSRIGPNAFALPGGTLVMTDELVTLLKADEQVIVGVLAHELGHVRHRHGLRMLVQVGALGAMASLLVGDFSSVLASIPVFLGQASYSRDAERQADEESVRIMLAAGISPAVMVTLFDRLAEKKQKSAQAAKPGDDASKKESEAPLGIAFASHPADAERVRYFKQQALQR
jgi:Zn-dependent protease with chaperone function